LKQREPRDVHQRPANNVIAPLGQGKEQRIRSGWGMNCLHSQSASHVVLSVKGDLDTENICTRYG